MVDEIKKQSADEITNDLASEPASEPALKREPGAEASSGDDLASDLGGLFGVSSKKKKKKKKVEPEPEPVVEVYDEGDDDLSDEPIESSPAPSAVKKKAPAPQAAPKDPVKKKKQAHGIEGVFATGRDSGRASQSDLGGSYLDQDDLGGATVGGPNKALIGVVVALAVALIGVVLFVTPIGQDVVALFKGEYREKKNAAVKREKDAFDAAQKAALPRFGNLIITGNPLYASIKLNGQEQYGQTSNGLWREVFLKPGYSNFGNLPVKTKQIIEVSSPGYDPATFELTEGKWQGDEEGPMSFNYVAQLVPSSEWDKMEFDARMGSDAENEFFGAVTIESNPAGADVRWNNQPLLDKKGEVLKTPVTFESNYVRDERGKLEEVPVKVDTTFDSGHKVEVFFEGQPDSPRYGTQLERQMWVCAKKDDSAIKRLPKDHSVQKECDYSFKKVVDFEGLKGYIEAREEEKKRILEYNAKVKELREEALKRRGELSKEEIEAMQR